MATGRNIDMCKALHQIIQEKLRWPDDDPEKLDKKNTLSFPNEECRKGHYETHDMNSAKENLALGAPGMQDIETEVPCRAPVF